jgi:hypothetical protein
MPIRVMGARPTIDRIMTVLETGADPNDADANPYASIGDRRDGAGLTAGKHQATDRAGSLAAIVREYGDADGATDPRTQTALAAYLPWLEQHGSIGDGYGNLNNADDFQARDDFVVLWRRAAEDPAMRGAQDRVFDRVYWTPAVGAAKRINLRTPLGYLVIYDTSIQSGGDGIVTTNRTDDAVWQIRRRFREMPPTPAHLPTQPTAAQHRDAEAAWVKAYLLARAGWLRSFPEGPVRTSAYRIDVLLGLLTAGNWALHLPLEIALPHKTVRLS